MIADVSSALKAALWSGFAGLGGTSRPSIGGLDTENDCYPCALLEIAASITTPSVRVRREDGSDV